MSRGVRRRPSTGHRSLENLVHLQELEVFHDDDLGFSRYYPFKLKERYMAWPWAILLPSFRSFREIPIISYPPSALRLYSTTVTPICTQSDSPRSESSCSLTVMHHSHHSPFTSTIQCCSTFIHDFSPVLNNLRALMLVGKIEVAEAEAVNTFLSFLDNLELLCLEMLSSVESWLQHPKTLGRQNRSFCWRS
jgi:hypothetical protein